MIYSTEVTPDWPGEPSAIVTSLFVGKTPANPIQDFGYYPSYANLNGEQRRTYLEWLSAGRYDADLSQRSMGYVFLFFYGLERRMILDRDRDPALLDEIIRLLRSYGPPHRSGSFKGYALQLLHFSGWQLGAEYYRAFWPQLLAFDDERPDQDGLRFVLANLHQLGEPMDWTVAYRVAMMDEESRRSTVIKRTGEKFWDLFQQRFNQTFPGGISLGAAKQDALVQYRPASGALMRLSYEKKRGNPFDVRLPNVAGFRRQFATLPGIWNSCVEDLSGYSRVLGSKKNGQAAALAAWQSLPQNLKRVEEHPMKSAFDELIVNASKEGECVFVPVAALASLAAIDNRAKLTIAQSRQVGMLVSDFSWHLAPNPEVTGLSLAWNQEVSLYPAIPGETIEPYVSGVLRLLYLAVIVAAANGAIEGNEMEAFHQLVAPQVQRDSDWRVLKATEAALRRDTNVALRSLPAIARVIPLDSRRLVLNTMARIAAVDNQVSLNELRILRRISKALGLGSANVDRLLQEDAAFGEVTVEGGREENRGEAIPPRRIENSAGFVLNEDRIKALTQETHEVISMLSVVMNDPEETSASPLNSATTIQSGHSVAPAEWLAGLNVRYHDALLALIQKDEMSIADFEEIATQHHLLPDDLLNSVNTWADETLGDFLLERDQNLHIFRNLLPEAAQLDVAA